MNYIVQKILASDPSAIQMARELGSFVSGEIVPLVANEDAGVRQIAVRCLNQSGGYGAAKVFVEALTDESPSVRCAALAALDDHLNEDVYASLLEIYNRVPDSQHRQELALILGKIAQAKLADLQKAFAGEPDAEALEGCLAALAKLGDPRSKAEMLNVLRTAKDRHLKRFLDYAEYVKEFWVLPGLMSVLNDKTPLVGSGICSMRPAPENDFEKPPEYLRACDIAVSLIEKLAGAKFPFPINGAKNYSDAELAAARRILAELLSR